MSENASINKFMYDCLKLFQQLFDQRGSFLNNAHELIIINKSKSKLKSNYKYPSSFDVYRELFFLELALLQTIYTN